MRFPNKEQLSLALRYVLGGKVKEVFVDLIFVERITEVLAQAILRWLSTWNLSHAHIRGQCKHGRCEVRVYGDYSAKSP